MKAVEMKSLEMSKAYDPKEFEDRLYRFWVENRLFEPDGEPAKKPYVIVIPPPNVTGVLHMGHGLNNCLQDILVRYHRMLQRPTLWLPGMDHAGIATQNVVEKSLRRRGTSREKVGREKFVEETWRVAREHQEVIRRQLQRIGSSCDWGRERFTLDEGLSRAVREVFVSLYEKGLIYKGNYLINWCPSCGTALSDDEVEHAEVRGKMYHYDYPLADGSGKVRIATTRPETMLGDTALAVHPEDARYRHLVGKLADLPLTGRRIPIVADGYVSMEIGSGVVKVTPAHDANDYDIGIRHKLPRINILNPDGTLNANVPEPYRGLPVADARRKVIEDIQAAGLFVREEDHLHQVGHCYRCQSVIEPYLSDQWFVRMRPLAEKALAAWKDGKVRFFPQKWENTYSHWLENIRDWCISRQLWWGHRIPVWYCPSCQEMVVSRSDPEACPCGSRDLVQDPDVLDTWFSSALWPFSTLGWPEKTADLAAFYPTSTLVTGYDIIFFWVARMIMMGMEFMQESPFQDVYIHGLVRDTQGRKMSKSLGNGIDPLEIVDEHGADALKFTIAFLAAQGQDILLGRDTFKLGSKFANKIWNASRYILMNLEGRTLLAPERLVANEVDRWIGHRLNETAAAVRTAMDGYRFNEAAQAVYEYFWSDFCDWYIEASKLSLHAGGKAEKDRAVTLLIGVLEESLRLLHPFLPFITEEIYQKLPRRADGGSRQASIVRAPYPEPSADRRDPQAEANVALLQELVRGVRTLRSEFTIPQEKKIRVAVKTEGGSTQEVLHHHRDLIALLTGASALAIQEEDPDRRGSIPVVGRGFEAFAYIKEAIDPGREIARLRKEQAAASSQIQRVKAKLANQAFVEKAPPEVVRGEERKLEELDRRVQKIDNYIQDLQR
jgi:valyl-tRNA synthetase